VQSFMLLIKPHNLAACFPPVRWISGSYCIISYHF